MGMHPQLGSLNDKHLRRLHFIKEIGCVCCHEVFGAMSPGGDGHHAEDEGGRAFSHSAMICLCKWHHVGTVPPGLNRHTALDVWGPTRHKHHTMFRERFGTDLELLEKQNALLESFLATFLIRPSI